MALDRLMACTGLWSVSAQRSWREAQAHRGDVLREEDPSWPGHPQTGVWTGLLWSSGRVSPAGGPAECVGAQTALRAAAVPRVP